MPFDLIRGWILAFLFTQIVEAPIYRRMLDVSWGRALAPSSVTHPFVWFAFPPLATALGLGWLGMAIMAELFAWLVEALLLAKTRPHVPLPKALLVSFLANASSVALGLTCRKLFGVP